jgi:hypothetical protein
VKKACRTCKQEKVFSDFYKRSKNPDSLDTQCKICSNAYHAEYRLNHSEKIKIYGIRTRTKYKEKYKLYREKNAIKTKIYKKIYDEKNALALKEKRKIYNNKHKQRRAMLDKNKYWNNLNFRITQNLRTRIRRAIKGQIKTGTSFKLLGCELPFLKLYLQNMFKNGMTWDNYGEWQIDHIRPCASFNLVKQEEQEKCFHYTNLQPLWALENLKKNNKIS